MHKYQMTCYRRHSLVATALLFLMIKAATVAGQGFELMVRRVALEVIDIIDATDHGARSSPFYTHVNA